ncbi:MAG: 1,2-phenylacetyl-CoA epoxidase subunit B [Aestuariivita sp.]|nr:1,2-phenylacetyl-CoA epoxidase subunit B [Aestuariivita sp.]MCY4202846.1 1,2-phenylacetyl-CoA epoxidase subunit B [Aestuariivita sp.]MCY4288752.1 1,2-phenylacetyl-CoA epoxidase subunit B [Aestuariivita sp.]MCY4346693.1 1,2-phenylacetyl-CoA epoxidase subunit B [Aestuariivita sp.]
MTTTTARKPDETVEPQQGKVGAPLFEVFIRSQNGLNHRHVGSLQAPDAKTALLNARDVYTRRNEGASIWVVESSKITASSPSEKGPLYDPSTSKIYRHPTFYCIPDDAGAI